MNQVRLNNYLGQKGVFLLNKQSSIYKGDMNELKKEGFGAISFEDGAKFLGNFIQNRANGWGKYKDGNKSIFKGII